ncbi:ribokinase [Kaistia soli DSM 19436]|uniref:Deoxyribokinase n=1 Tax=Kaistia soli DSM 19436 TaxID=1122133 RepID=A0A1M5IMX3_9HYPH|nr:ribokinase [Kaistia soli]SHG29591.1 ribokinase [Kaistia soli DSM 19436]
MRVLVLGAVMIDEAMTVATFPNPGATVIAGAPQRDLGGKGANQAIVLKRAAVDVRLVAPVGEDADAEWVAEALTSEGIEVADLVPLGRSTDRSLIFVGPGGENAIASIIGAAEAVDERLARESVDLLGPGDLLVMQGNLTLDATRAALDAARAQGAATLLNPSPIRAEMAALFPLVDCLIVNEGEARLLSGKDTPLEAAIELREDGPGTVVVTLGRLGALALGDDGPVEIAGEPVKAVDSTGAGDTFAAVFAAARYDRGLSLGDSLAAATRAAAITVSRKGTRAAFPTRDELAAILPGR